MKLKTTVFLLLILLIINGKALGYNLPLPPETVKEKGQQRSFNNTQYLGEIYRSRLTEKELASFYKDTLGQEGFTLISEEITSADFLQFVNLTSKDHVFILIESALEGQIQLNITSWQGDVSFFDVTAKNTGDSPGKDLAGIPRYPGSVRLASFQISDVKNVSYRTPANKEDIISFYEEKIPSYGWRVVPETDMAKQKIAELFGGNAILQSNRPLFYEKKDTLLVISVMSDCCGSKDSLITMGLSRK